MTRQIKKFNLQRLQLLEIKFSFDEAINSETMFHYRTRSNQMASIFQVMAHFTTRMKTELIFDFIRT